MPIVGTFNYENSIREIPTILIENPVRNFNAPIYYENFKEAIANKHPFEKQIFIKHKYTVASKYLENLKKNLAELNEESKDLIKKSQTYYQPSSTLSGQLELIKIELEDLKKHFENLKSRIETNQHLSKRSLQQLEESRTPIESVNKYSKIDAEQQTKLFNYVPTINLLIEQISQHTYTVESNLESKENWEGVITYLFDALKTNTSRLF